MGGVFKLSTQAISNICNIYREGIGTFEKILTIERRMYPTIAKEAAKTGSKTK